MKTLEHDMQDEDITAHFPPFRMPHTTGPLKGGKLFSYSAGSPKGGYSDSAEVTPNPNPIHAPTPEQAMAWSQAQSDLRPAPHDGLDYQGRLHDKSADEFDATYDRPVPDWITFGLPVAAVLVLGLTWAFAPEILSGWGVFVELAGDVVDAVRALF